MIVTEPIHAIEIELAGELTRIYSELFALDAPAVHVHFRDETIVYAIEAQLPPRDERRRQLVEDAMAELVRERVGREIVRPVRVNHTAEGGAVVVMRLG